MAWADSFLFFHHDFNISMDIPLPGWSVKSLGYEDCLYLSILSTFVFIHMQSLMQVPAAAKAGGSWETGFCCLKLIPPIPMISRSQEIVLKRHFWE